MVLCLITEKLEKAPLSFIMAGSRGQARSLNRTMKKPCVSVDNTDRQAFYCERGLHIRASRQAGAHTHIHTYTHTYALTTHTHMQTDKHTLTEMRAHADRHKRKTNSHT